MIIEFTIIKQSEAFSNDLDSSEQRVAVKIGEELNIYLVIYGIFGVIYKWAVIYSDVTKVFLNRACPFLSISTRIHVTPR